MPFNPKVFYISLLLICVESKAQLHFIKEDSTQLIPGFRVAEKKHMVVGYVRKTCKQGYAVLGSEYVVNSVRAERFPVSRNIISKKHKQFLKIHGNIMYDYFYQSYLDTPYAGSELQQHTLSTYLNLFVKESYPFKVAFTLRLGNQDYLRSFSALNLNFDQNSFTNSIRATAKDWASSQLKVDTSSLAALRQQLNETTKKIGTLKAWLSSPSVLQEIIRVREQKLGESISQNQSKTNDTLFRNKQLLSNDIEKDNSRGWGRNIVINHASSKEKLEMTDSSNSQIEKRYADGKLKLDSLQKKSDSVVYCFYQEKKRLDSIYKSASSQLTDLRDKNRWKNNLKKLASPDSILPKGYKELLSLKKFSLGTSVVNYSELSAKDLTITGLQVEYNPKYYYAVAGGVINYRFRDYLLPQPSGPSQYLGLVRFGKQDAQGNGLIFTYYFGRKQLYNYFSTDSASNSNNNPNYSLMGFTIEKGIALTKNINIKAEVAKSTMPFYNRVDIHGKVTSGFINLQNRSNEAYAVKADVLLPKTQTKLDGYFKRYGENFQSFTLFSTNTRQTAWLIHASQPFFKNQFLLNGSLKKNDYIDPFINQQYVSNILFKSIQGILRIRKLPVLTVGYYPTSQLTKLSNSYYSENVFYTLVSSISYNYKIRNLSMNTTGLITRFYNRPLDSNYAYYNSTNYILDHNVSWNNVSINTGFSKSTNGQYSLVTTSCGLQLKVKKWFLAGGALKYNKQTSFSSKLGYSANSTFIVSSIGTLQFKIQKAFLPGPDKELVPDNIGRFTFYRNF